MSNGVLKVASAGINNASPVHGPVVGLEADVNNASFIAVGVDFEGLQELSVFIGNRLNNLSPVQFNFLSSFLDDVVQLLFVNMLVLMHLRCGVHSKSISILNELSGLSDFLSEIDFQSHSGDGDNSQHGKDLC